MGRDSSLVFEDKNQLIFKTFIKNIIKFQWKKKQQRKKGRGGDRSKYGKAQPKVSQRYFHIFIILTMPSLSLYHYFTM